MKYHNNLTKGSQDIEWTSSGLPTDIPTDRLTGAKQYAPLHKKTKPETRFPRHIFWTTFTNNEL
jgi:hypothetical protein